MGRESDQLIPEKKGKPPMGEDGKGYFAAP
jgi:hypothetical protein